MARVAGLRGFAPPTLEAVEKRRFQLWLTTLFLLAVTATALVALTFWDHLHPPAWLTLRAMQGGLLLLTALFCVYALEKELQLRRLARMLVEERVLTAALTNRLREVTPLLEAARAMNRVLELADVLDTILSCTMDLLEGRDASIMLLHGEDQLRTVCVTGSSQAQGAFASIGKGIAGRVAAEGEPLLIEGALVHPDREESPRSSMSVPLIHRGRLLGVLNLNGEPGRRYTEHDLRALSLFGEQAAGAIAHAQLYESERLMASQKHYQALHDALTTLPNRVLFTDRLEVALAARPDSGRSRVALLFLDLDRFKEINDRFGHSTGDEALVAFAERLQRSIRSGDAVARFGGDEFMVLLQGVRSTEDATGIAERLLGNLSGPLDLHGQRAEVHATGGLAVSGPSSTAEGLIREAASALRYAKERERKAVTVFDDEMRGAGDELLIDLETQLRAAIERRQLEVFYQPIVELGSGLAVGAEGLVRWHHPQRGLLTAASFVPLAEQIGLLPAIDQWVLRQATSELATIRHGLSSRDFYLSLNVSSTRLQDSALIGEITDTLAASGCRPSELQIEVTERAVAKGGVGVTSRLRELQGLGVAIAFDDFGTGFSTLSHLTEHPVDVVKIDRAFVRGIRSDAGAQNLVQSILRLGQGLTLQVVAEGIEIEPQLARLLELGCRLGQGDLMAQPLPLPGLLEFLARAPG